ncbi:helix-turn-helix domain-containing protein [Enterococcus hirae]|uniref:helix-turn-helix domain-containing protein n=1 Tax=Enterococcus hirae TaxID=1354 RepID=UPI0015F28B5F|nr:helix-turn-helix transcriptional regulator [Enterococcus hirae]MBA5264950.1 helix-turn-helix transcriptional regulator [Enterococcus hirae]
MNRIRYLRNQKNLSLQDLQDQLLEKEKIKIGRASLNNYERGTQTPKKETWEKIANFFGVDVAYLMGLSDFPNPKESDPQIVDFLNHIESKKKDLINKSTKSILEKNETNPDIGKIIMALDGILKNSNETEISRFLALLNSINVFKKEKNSVFIENREDKAIYKSRDKSNQDIFHEYFSTKENFDKLIDPLLEKKIQNLLNN